jgi:hypothetical protein
MAGILRGSIAKYEDVECALDIFINYCASKKGKQLQDLLKHLNDLATKLCDLYDRT